MIFFLGFFFSSSKNGHGVDYWISFLDTYIIFCLYIHVGIVRNNSYNNIDTKRYLYYTTCHRLVQLLYYYYYDDDDDFFFHSKHISPMNVETCMYRTCSLTCLPIDDGGFFFQAIMIFFSSQHIISTVFTILFYFFEFLRKSR